MSSEAPVTDDYRRMTKAKSRRWRIAAASVAGTSHAATATPCQDAHLHRVVECENGPVLILVVSDGAGSARLSHEGSEIACAAIADAIEETLRQRSRVGTVRPAEVEGWVLAVQSAVGDEAQRSGNAMRDYRCTLLAAIVGRSEAAYLQIGDGAIVIQPDHGEMQTVFWPENGEFVNTTFFATDAESLQHARVRCNAPAPKAVAVFSDGLQMLALSFRDQKVHAPFFAPLFATLASTTGSADEVNNSLAALLASPAINQRTDDDKTLVLAAVR